MLKRYCAFMLGAFLVITPLTIAFADNYAGNLAATGDFGGPVDRPLDWGGPDAYGYYFYDSNDSAFNAPVYNWREISGYGTEINFTGDDENLGPFLIGFTFNFYSVDFLTFRVCTNGFISLTSTDNEWINVGIPNVAEPNNLVAPYWDDLYIGTGSHAYYYSNGDDTLIVEWQNMRFVGDTGAVTLEAVITGDGNMLFQYQSNTGRINSHTIGIENQGGTVGLQYIYNTARDETGTAILFSLTPPDHGQKDVLVVAADPATEYITALNAYVDIGTIDFFDAQTGTPTLQELQEYDCAVVWSNYSFSDPVGLGNVLADYVDAGGGVVLQNFSYYQGWQLQGRIMSDYCPLGIGSSFARRVLGTYDAGHPIMAGVTSFIDTFAIALTVVNDPIVVASYGDGTPLVAYHPERDIVAINSYMGNNQRNGGQVVLLSHNAIKFVTRESANILIAHSDPIGISEIRSALMGYPDIGGIDVYNAQVGTPSLRFLQEYDVVVVWSNAALSDSVMMGNRLADYLDSDGAVVLAMFCFANNWQISGRIMSSYSPFGRGARRTETRTLGWHDTNHQLMEGITAYNEYYTVNVPIINGGITVASWDDSSPFVGYCPTRDLVAINGYFGNANNNGGDVVTLMHNAVNFARHVGVEDGGTLPGQISLAQNYPNPFNPKTTIAFDIPRASHVNLEVYNLLGQRVAVVHDGYLGAGHHALIFDASALGSGVYFYRLNAGENSTARKMVVLK